jgi:hypothetical protein
MVIAPKKAGIKVIALFTNAYYDNWVITDDGEVLELTKSKRFVVIKTKGSIKDAFDWLLKDRKKDLFVSNYTYNQATYTIRDRDKLKEYGLTLIVPSPNVLEIFYVNWFDNKQPYAKMIYDEAEINKPPRHEELVEAHPSTQARPKMVIAPKKIAKKGSASATKVFDNQDLTRYINQFNKFNAIKNDFEYFNKKYPSVRDRNNVIDKILKLSIKYANNHGKFADYFETLVLDYMNDENKYTVIVGDKDESDILGALYGKDEFLIRGNEEYWGVDSILPFLEELKKKKYIKFEYVFLPEIEKLYSNYIKEEEERHYAVLEEARPYNWWDEVEPKMIIKKKVDISTLSLTELRNEYNTSVDEYRKAKEEYTIAEEALNKAQESGQPVQIALKKNALTTKKEKISKARDNAEKIKKIYYKMKEKVGKGRKC